jgi:hypothetical protein
MMNLQICKTEKHNNADLSFHDGSQVKTPKDLQNSKPLQTLKIPKLKREMKKQLNQPLMISSPP